MKPFVISAISHKGGSSKSTTIINLLVAAHLDGKLAIALDLDDGASTSDWYAARKNPKRLQQLAVERLRVPAWEDTNPDLQHAYDELLTMYSMPFVQPTHHAGIAQQLEIAEKQGVELVFIDTKGGTEQATMTALEASDLVVVPLIVSQMDLRQIVRTVRLCRAEDKEYFALLGDFDASGSELDDTRKGLEAAGVTVVPGGFGHRKAYKRCLTPGLGVMEYEPKGTAAQEVSNVYKYICAMIDRKRVSTSEGKRVAG